MELAKKAAVYYARKDIQKAIVDFSKGREIAFNYDGHFGKRPDILEYESEFKGIIEKGVTSFHCSEELWKNPLDLKTELPKEELDNLRAGWDLIIDIDSDYLEYSKISARLIISALKFHNVTNIGLKYSGNKGFHIGIPWAAFPKEVNGTQTEKLFPELPRIIAQYLTYFIKEKLVDEISKLTQKNKYIRGNEKAGDFAEDVMPDIVLVSSRHLFRAPYSLNEKSGLVSMVISPEHLKDFDKEWAKPERMIPKPFLPIPKKDEANELVMQALDWHKKVYKIKADETKPFQQNYIIKDSSPEMYPPCIKKILEGVKSDGRKRALFILTNFFRSINLSEKEINEKISVWNKLNYQPLREGYVVSQLSWSARHKSMLPPNCINSRYKDLAVCSPDFICSKIKNPVNYTLLISKRNAMKSKPSAKTKRPEGKTPKRPKKQ